MLLSIFKLLSISTIFYYVESSTHPNIVIRNYRRALEIKSKEGLLNILADDFRLYDCSGRPFLSREQFIRVIEEYQIDDEVRTMIAEVTKTQEKNDKGYRFTAKIEDRTINEYETNKDGKIIYEKLTNCKSRNLIATTSIIDDDANVAWTVLKRYLGALMRIYNFEQILLPEFTITRCDKTIISKDLLMKIYTYTDGNIVTTNLKRLYITNVKHIDRQWLFFDVEMRTGSSVVYSIIHFEAKLVYGHYRIISEEQTECETVPDATALIDGEATIKKTIKAIGADYHRALHTKSLALFQKITWEKMTILLCTESYYPVDLLMWRDDYFNMMIMQYDYFSIDYTDVRDVEGDLLSGEMKWSIYTDSAADGRNFYEAKINPKSGKMMIISEQRRQCLIEQEITDFGVYLQKEMQELIDNFVEAINTRNSTRFAELTESPFKMSSFNFKNKTVDTEFTRTCSSYRSKLPKLTVYTIPNVEEGIIEFSAEGEYLDNRYTAKRVDWKYVLVSETKRNWMADYVRREEEFSY